MPQCIDAFMLVCMTVRLLCYLDLRGGGDVWWSVRRRNIFSRRFIIILIHKYKYVIYFPADSIHHHPDT